MGLGLVCALSREVYAQLQVLNEWGMNGVRVKTPVKQVLGRAFPIFVVDRLVVQLHFEIAHYPKQGLI